MIRNIAMLLLLVGSAAFAGNEFGPMSASERQQLFVKNQSMVRALVDSSLEISDKSGDYLERSRSYGKVLMEIQRQLDRADAEGDGRRVAELGKHLNTVMRQGLTPSLKSAHVQIGVGGTGRNELIDLRDRNLEFVDWLQDKARNKWADTAEVRQIIESLDETKKQLGTSVGP